MTFESIEYDEEDDSPQEVTLPEVLFWVGLLCFGILLMLLLGI